MLSSAPGMQRHIRGACSRPAPTYSARQHPRRRAPLPAVRVRVPSRDCPKWNLRSRRRPRSNTSRPARNVQARAAGPSRLLVQNTAARAAGRPWCTQKVRHTALVEIPRVEIIRTFASRAPTLDLSELRLDRADDCLCDLVLHGEYVGQFAIVALRPKLSSGGSLR